MSQDASPQSGPTGQPSSKAVISLLIGVGIAVALVGIGAAIRASLHSQPAAASTITYAVDGGPATVTYGPAGSMAGHGSPMTVTAPLGDAAYYFISAQLNGSGSVSCQISVDGTPVSQGAATADYGIASCEIASDGAGGWRSVTG